LPSGSAWVVVSAGNARKIHEKFAAARNREASRREQTSALADLLAAPIGHFATAVPARSYGAAAVIPFYDAWL
jgi:hypothetical protein